MLQQLTYWKKRIDFLVYLSERRAEIEALVSYHLGLSGNRTCSLAPLNDWIHGSFNMCLPVYVDNWKNRPKGRVIIRFPLPYKVGEEKFPGNADEKLRCEAASYIWIQQNCPDVPIPRLLGFAFSGHQCVSYENPRSSYLRLNVVYKVHRTGIYPLVHPIHGILSAAITFFVQLSSSLPIHLPPRTARSKVWISAHRLH